MRRCNLFGCSCPKVLAPVHDFYTNLQIISSLTTYNSSICSQICLFTSKLDDYAVYCMDCTPLHFLNKYDGLFFFTIWLYSLVMNMFLCNGYMWVHVSFSQAWNSSPLPVLVWSWCIHCEIFYAFYLSIINFNFLLLVCRVSTVLINWPGFTLLSIQYRWFKMH